MKTFIKYKVDEKLHSIALTTTTSLMFILLSKLNERKLSSRKINVLGITSQKSHLCDVDFVFLTFVFISSCHTSNFIYPTNGIKCSNSSKRKAEMRSLSRIKACTLDFITPHLSAKTRWYDSRG